MRVISPPLKFREIPVVDSVSQEVWACWNLLNLQLGEKKNKKQTGVLDASAKRSSGNTTSRNEVINHILY